MKLDFHLLQHINPGLVCLFVILHLHISLKKFFSRTFYLLPDDYIFTLISYTTSDPETHKKHQVIWSHWCDCRLQRVNQNCVYLYVGGGGGFTFVMISFRKKNLVSQQHHESLKLNLCLELQCFINFGKYLQYVFVCLCVRKSISTAGTPWFLNLHCGRAFTDPEL